MKKGTKKQGPRQRRQSSGNSGSKTALSPDEERRFRERTGRTTARLCRVLLASDQKRDVDQFLAVWDLPDPDSEQAKNLREERLSRFERDWVMREPDKKVDHRVWLWSLALQGLRTWRDQREADYRDIIEFLFRLDTVFFLEVPWIRRVIRGWLQSGEVEEIRRVFFGPAKKGRPSLRPPSWRAGRDNWIHDRVEERRKGGSTFNAAARDVTRALRPNVFMSEGNVKRIYREVQAEGGSAKRLLNEPIYKLLETGLGNALSEDVEPALSES